jgi:hypothetical protein
MRIMLDEKPVDALTPKNAGSQMRPRIAEQASGMVYTPDEAKTAVTEQNSRVLVLVGAIAVMLIGGIMIAGSSYEPSSTAAFAITGVLLVGSLMVFMYFLHQLRIRKWSEKLDHRLQGLAPAGTTVSIDANGLTVGGDSFAWPSLAIELVEVRTFSVADSDDVTHMVERLQIKTQDRRTLVLDRYMVSDGAMLVDSVWRRLSQGKG